MRAFLLSHHSSLMSIIVIYRARICSSICLIVSMNLSSLSPVGSEISQSQSKSLPIYGHPTSHPIEIAISGAGILSTVLLNWACSISIP